MTSRDAVHETGADRSGPSRLVLGVLCLAQFMLMVDVVVVNVALPSIRADLAIPDSRLQLVAVGYTLTFGSLLIVFGRAGDLLGRRRLFLLGMAFFTVASLVTGLAASEWQLVVARAAQGVGAAMVSPSALSLLTATFAEGEQRNRALGYWAAVGAAGAIAGQLLGGVLTHAVGWRAIFVVNVPVGVLAIVIGHRHLPESRGDVETRSPLDVRGSVLLVAGLATTIVCLTAAASGAAPLTSLVVAVAALAIFGLLIRVEREHPAPLLSRALLRTESVLVGNGLLAISAAGLGATLFFTTLYLQVVRGYSALAVGAAFAPITLVILLLSPQVARHVAARGPRRLLTIGLTLEAVAMALLARLPESGSYGRDVLPALLLLAVGSAFAYAPIFVVGTSGVGEREQGLAAGLLNASQELGAAVGMTVLATVAATASRGGTLVSGYRVGLVAAAAVTASGLLLVRRLESGAASAASRTVG